VSRNIAVIYTGNLAAVAESFGEGAAHVATGVRVLRLEGRQPTGPGGHDSPTLGDLEWTDGLWFGTPTGGGTPAPELMRFLEGTEPLWSSGRRFDKAVTVFTDRPEH
jgi:multimeric flavodoxin WrbA